MTKNKIWTINILVSFTTMTLLYIFKEELVLGLCNFLISIFKPLSSLTINPFDLIIISCIPLWSYPIYAKNISPTPRQITLINLFSLTVLLLTSIIGFIFIDIFSKPTSPWIPKYVVTMPFSFFPTITLTSGILITYALFYLFRRTKPKTINI